MGGKSVISFREKKNQTKIPRTLEVLTRAKVVGLREEIEWVQGVETDDGAGCKVPRFGGNNT